MTTFSYRSMLFVPPADGSKIARASQSPADALILDWEDGTALGDKPAARRATLEYLAAMSASKPVWVRLNPAGTPAFQDDVEALRTTVPPGLVLAKCTSAPEALDLLTLLDRQCRLMPLIESASGLLASAEIARCSPQIAALGFGAEDFTASINAIQGPDERELLFARSTIVVASRAAGIEPIDSPCLDYKDPSAVTTSARLARRLGFSGKMAIHPAQLAAVNEAFTPLSAEIEAARALVDAFDSQKSGAAGFGGKMVDEAVVRRARRLLGQNE